eukprot:TRINITY_DN11647_c0_g1_i1.p1 TRINITY_DN11647_c0_g1~~TRINITY_DN11647_c0_g1_i1.p1  ORF type:complete len:599 (+),score=159.08 TRINITY_DN11647_c0_g1_i1:47-1843(+)
MSAPCMLGPDGSVDEYLDNLVRTSRGRLIRSPDCSRVVFRGDLGSDDLRGRVALISGGGSGHEPSFAGTVGPGLLTAAVVGNLFASPPVAHILGSMKAVSKGASGILLLPMNYMGDRLNFGMALHRFKSLYPGIPVEMLLIRDDCGTAEDKRGVAGTILVHKIAGAMANLGKSLDEIVHFLSTKILPKLRSIGLSLSPLRLPGRSEDSFHLEDGEMELGTGIHGEAGVKRLRLQSPKESAQTMFEKLADGKKEESVVLLVNNLGGTSQLEMGVMTGEAVRLLESKGLKVERTYTGSFMTSLRMVGFSFTVLRLGVSPDEATGGLFARSNPEVLRYLDAPTTVPMWSGPSWSSQALSSDPKMIDFKIEKEKKLDKGPLLESKLAVQGLEKALTFACEALSSCDGQLNTMDRGSGDGDTGTTLKNGVDRVLQLISQRKIHASHPISLLRTLSAIAETHMGGTSGALYSIFFSSLSCHFASGIEGTSYSLSSFIEGMDKGTKAISEYGESKLGDRTMLDALVPYIRSFQGSSGDLVSRFDAATRAAEKGAMETLSMKAKVGRAARVNQSELIHADPGAHAVGIICRAVNEAVKRVYSQHHP